MYDEPYTLIDYYATTFSTLYLLSSLLLGGKVSSAMRDLLNLTFYLDTNGKNKRVLEKRPYIEQEERKKLGKEDKSKALPKRLTKRDHEQLPPLLTKVKSAKRNLFYALVGIFVLHAIATFLMFADDPMMWLIVPGAFLFFYSACLYARKSNRLKTLARMDGGSYRNTGFN